MSLIDFGEMLPVKISPRDDGAWLQFHLCSSDELNAQRISFDMTSDSAMALMAALQRLQAAHALQVPSNDTLYAKPRLMIVKDDE